MEEMLDLTLRAGADGHVEGSAWLATLPPGLLQMADAYTVRGTAEGDRLVLALTSVTTPGSWRDSLTLVARADAAGRLEATLAPASPTPQIPWHAAGTLARSDSSYGAGTLSVARGDGQQRTIPTLVRPSSDGGGWRMGEATYVALELPGARLAVGTYRVVPGRVGSGGAPGGARVTFGQSCSRGGCLEYQAAAGDTGEVVVTVATATRVAGTYRVSATRTAVGPFPPPPPAGAAERVVATGAFDVPCLAAACR
jgi:hypothetical protein